MVKMRHTTLPEHARLIDEMRVFDGGAEYEQLLTPLIKDEFNLTDFRYDIDSHWNIGQGWSEHDF